MGFEKIVGRAMEVRRKHTKLEEKNMDNNGKLQN